MSFLLWLFILDKVDRAIEVSRRNHLSPAERAAEHAAKATQEVETRVCCGIGALILIALLSYAFIATLRF